MDEFENTRELRKVFSGEIDLSSENKKSTLMVDEKDILRMAEKIRLNENERANFEKDLHALLGGDKKISSKPLTVGITTNALAICGADGALPLTITKKVIDKAMRPENRDENGRLVGKTGHGLSEKQILQVLDELKNPAMIFQGSREDSLLAVTTVKDEKDRNIVVAVELDKQEQFRIVNSIRSPYGRDNMEEYIEKSMEKGMLLAVNKRKADEMLLSIGKSYPKENSFISFNDSIAYTTQNVKDFPIGAYIPNILAINAKKADMLADTEVQFFQSINDTVIRYDDSISYTLKNVKSFNGETKINERRKNVMKRFFIETNSCNMVALVDDNDKAFVIHESFNKETTLEMAKNADYQKLDECKTAEDCARVMEMSEKLIIDFKKLMSCAKSYTEFTKDGTAHETYIKDNLLGWVKKGTTETTESDESADNSIHRGR